MSGRTLQNLFKGFFSPVLLTRVFFVLLATWCGMVLADPRKPVEFLGSGEVVIYERWLYSLLAFIAALIIVTVEYAADVISSHKILMASIGLLAGLVFSFFFYTTIPSSVVNPENARVACNMLFGYMGAVIAIKHAERFHLSRLRFFLTQSHEQPKVLDSSVIIDGRIRELIDLQVIVGQILVPTFVVQELQRIADSNDPNRKMRGRRGLEILESLQEICKTLDIVDKDYPDQREVDHKLVQLCRDMGAELITNDVNLQKTAHVHGLTVINVNAIAEALRPTVFIGESLELTIVREGKEQGQGVGYLEDGTMVVVDDASRLIGETVDVVVTSILQTGAGRLVFARPQHHA